MQYFTNPTSGKAVKLNELAARTAITVSDASGHVSRTCDRPAAHYVRILSERGYQPATAEQYAAARMALQSEQKYNFSPELGKALYAQLAA